MKGSLNRATLFGFLERDPEIDENNNSGRVAKLVISTHDSQHADECAEQFERHQVIVTDELLIELVERDLRKGSKVFVEARLQSHVWSDHSGREHWGAELVVETQSGLLITFAGRHGIGVSDPIEASN